jgi:hypothetical protein
MTILSVPYTVVLAFLIICPNNLWLLQNSPCASSRKVASSIPDGFTGNSHLHNPSSRTTALGLTQPLTEMSTRNISWGLRRPVRRADNLTTFICQLPWNLGASTFWTLRACPGQACNGIAFYRMPLWSQRWMEEPISRAMFTFINFKRITCCHPNFLLPNRSVCAPQL